MDLETLHQYFLSKPGTEECFPFDQTTLVFKVAGKMFGLLSLDGDLTINLKCDPDLAIELRNKYTEVSPGYHMNKKHWNTIQISDTLSDHIIKEWIDQSYALVCNGLSKKEKSLISK